VERGRVTLVGRVAATKSRLAASLSSRVSGVLQFVSVGFLGGEQLAQVEGGGDQCRFSSLSAASLRCQRNREGTSFTG